MRAIDACWCGRPWPHAPSEGCDHVPCVTCGGPTLSGDKPCTYCQDTLDDLTHLLKTPGGRARVAIAIADALAQPPTTEDTRTWCPECFHPVEDHLNEQSRTAMQRGREVPLPFCFITGCRCGRSRESLRAYETNAEPRGCPGRG